uniref:Secreted protein n=1 Tax=Meloidogyne hapla TaxID=6305 RepID=A0A1I8BLG9_MELHA
MSKIAILNLILITLNSMYCTFCMDPPRIRTATCRHYKTKEDCLTSWIVGQKSIGSWCQWTTLYGYQTCEWSPESIEIHHCRPKSSDNCKWGSCRSAPLSCMSRVTHGSCERTTAYNGTNCRWYNVRLN